MKRWQRVYTAADFPACDGCGEPFCAKHGEHFADCACIGISEADERGPIKERHGRWYVLAPVGGAAGE
jgi:hypothetical protein